MESQDNIYWVRVPKIMVMMGLLILVPPVFASNMQHKQKCDAEIKKAEEACNKAGQEAKQAGQNSNNAGQAQDAAHGGNSDRGSNNLCPRIQKQKQDIDNAMGKCEAARAACKSKCDAEKAQDDLHPTLQPPKAKTNPDPTQCMSKTQPQMTEMGKSAAPLPGQAAEACKSGDESKSGGQPPQMPPPPQDDKKDDKKDDPLRCEGDEGARYSDCNAAYIAKCNNNLSQSGCEAFANRYCGAAGSGAAIPSSPAKPGLVADKTGEGLGSGFCKMYSAYKFCKSNAASSECPSCRGSYAFSTPQCQADPLQCIPVDALKNAQTSCPLDPLFSDPKTAAEIAKLVENNEKKNDPPATQIPGQTGSGGSTTGNNGSGGLAVGGGGGNPGGYSEGQGGGAGSGYGAVPESASGGAGGGGGGYAAASLGEEAGEAAADGAGAGQGSAETADSAAASDVGNRYGHTLFSITSAVYKGRCERGLFNPCRAH